MKVDLTDQEWQQVLTLISEAPWKVANPLLMRMGQQLQMQQKGPDDAASDKRIDAGSGNSGAAGTDRRADGMEVRDH